MNIPTLRKHYSYLVDRNIKNLKWRKLTDTEIHNAIMEKQVTCSCFHFASRIALLNSKRGREIIRDRVKVAKNSKGDQAYRFTLSPNGKKEVYRVTNGDYAGKFFNLFRFYNENPCVKGNFLESLSANLNLAFDIAVTKMITKYPKQKPWYMRLHNFPKNYKCEYNKPSKAFEWLTGIKPEIIGEDGIKNGLYNEEEKTIKLLDKLGNLSFQDYSYILMSGQTKNLYIEKWHCVPILNVDNEKQQVKVYDQRHNEIIYIPFKRIINSFKAIVGINWKENSIPINELFKSQGK